MRDNQLIQLDIKTLDYLYNVEKLSSLKLAKHFNCSKSSILRIMKSNNITRRKMSEAKRIFTINEHYFDVIDSEEKAYWLGFIYADGNIYQNKLQVGLSNTDLNHLIKLKNTLNSGQNLYKDRTCTKLIVHSDILTNNLIKLGCFKKKSFTIRFPTKEQVPDNLLRHFMRGMFDGDGCIITNLETKHWHFQLNSNLEFCKIYYSVLLQGSGFKKKRGNVYKEKRRETDCWFINIGSTNKVNLFKIFTYLYCGASIFLERKKNKFEKMIYAK